MQALAQDREIVASSLMKSIQGEFEQVARQVNYSKPRINIIANVTGEIASKEIEIPEYWCLQIGLEPIFWFKATFGDIWLRQGSYADGRGHSGKEGKCPKLLWHKDFKTSAICLLPSALKRVPVLITES